MLLVIGFIIIAAFTLGYQLGISNTLASLSSNTYTLAQHSEHNQTNSVNSTNTGKNLHELAPNESTALSNRTALSNDIDASASTIDTSEAALSSLILKTSSGLLMNKESSTKDMLAFLNDISKSTTSADINLYGPAMDLIQQAINDNPNRMDELVEYFVEADASSRSTFYITSLIQGSDLSNKTEIINDLITRLSDLGDDLSNSKLLNLVSNTGAHYDNQEVTNSIKNIALYSQNQDNNRMYALDLLKPFQLSNQEKEVLVSNFTVELEQGDNIEKAALLENIIRFSDIQKRPQIAANYLSDAHELQTRVAVLSAVHRGTVSKTNALKQQLFNIAEDGNDPLNSHAKDTLIYAFEINNEEYIRLKGDAQ